MTTLILASRTTGSHNEGVPEVAATLDIARGAAASQGWRTAYETYADVAANELEPSDLENYGEAAWWNGKLDEAIGLRERAYAGYSADGDTLAAARLALTLSWDYDGRGAPIARTTGAGHVWDRRVRVPDHHAVAGPGRVAGSGPVGSALQPAGPPPTLDDDIDERNGSA